MNASCAGLQAIVTMLPHTEAAQRVYQDPAAGILAGAAAASRSSQQNGPLQLIDCSTIAPAYSRALASAVAAAPAHRPLTFIDAPVSGGVPAASAGALTFMCGGTPEAVEAARPLLLAMGRRVIHCGAAGEVAQPAVTVLERN